MAGQLVMKNTFWHFEEMSPEELEFTVQQRRQRAYTDMYVEYTNVRSSDFDSFTSTDVGSPKSTDTGDSSPVSSGSPAGDASDRWADICDTDDELPVLSSLPRGGACISPPGAWFAASVQPTGEKNDRCGGKSKAACFRSKGCERKRKSSNPGEAAKSTSP
jgi:hypothetical protein